jgi:hypothetical protein
MPDEQNHPPLTEIVPDVDGSEVGDAIYPDDEESDGNGD